MTIGRPKQFDADKVVSNAMNQFWIGGYFSTSLQDLLACTDLSKSSLYQSFGNKEQLFIRCLEQYEQYTDEMLKALLHETDSGIDFIRLLLDSVIDEANMPEPKGCLLLNTVNEQLGNESDITEAVNRGLATVKKNINLALEQAKVEGELSSDVSSDQMSDYIMTTISGLRTFVKAGADRSSLEKVVDLVMTTLK